MSAVTPNSEICETIDTWITTAKNATTAIRRARWRLLSLFIAGCAPTGSRAEVRPGQDLHER